MTANSIREVVSVAAHPTVVRLDSLDTAGAEWIEESYCLTDDVRRHLRALQSAFSGEQGKGIFVIGQYGSGKSHLLAWIIQRLRAGDFVENGPDVAFVSLINFGASMRIEEIVQDALGIPVRDGDRRVAWEEVAGRFDRGLVLVLDELSEFLRSKADHRAFNEDIRFLQFLGEWSCGRRFWIMGALQESIERTGDIEYDLYRKIKDRYPLRLILSPAHIRDLIAHSVLKKRAGYETQVAALVERLEKSVPRNVQVDAELLSSIYPVHPATLALLEEVRDRFSQARGVIDFAVTQLRGDDQRGVSAFLDRPFGDLITPDVIVDHYKDLLAIQPEFLALSDKVFPFYEKQMARLFAKKTLRALAFRLLKLLAVVFLSRSRKGVTPSEATYWLGFFAVHIAPEKNVKIVADALGKLASEGQYVKSEKGRYFLHTEEDASGAFSRRLLRELSELRGAEETLFEELSSLLSRDRLNPFSLGRDAWQPRDVEWHHHPRRCAFYIGNDEPEARGGVTLVIRLPFGKSAPSPVHHTVVPSQLAFTDAMREALACARLLSKPLDRTVAAKAEKMLAERVRLIGHELATTYRGAKRLGPGAATEFAAGSAAHATTEEWLADHFRWVLRRTFPAFERFAPTSGPLPLETYRTFISFCRKHDVESVSDDPQVDLIRETYLVPMKLLNGAGRGYRIPANLERHELIKLLAPVIQHNPAPEVVYKYLAEPVFGLVQDQVHALLLFLYTQGDIDIIKGNRTLGDLFETLPTPLKYDRIEKGGSLEPRLARALEQLCAALKVKPASQGTAISQRQAASRAAAAARSRVTSLSLLVFNLEPMAGTDELACRLRRFIGWTEAFTRTPDSLQGFYDLIDAAGSVERYLDELLALSPLPERLQRLIGERDRYLHLMRGLPHAVPVSPDTAVMLDAAGHPPPLDAVEALEKWLEQAGRAYSAYADTYKRCHEETYAALERHPALEWRLPEAARVRQVGLATAVERYLDLCREVDQRRCRQLSNLAFQSVCACGFDGEQAPVEGPLAALAEVERKIESVLWGFFAKREVQKKVAALAKERREMAPAFKPYLEGAAKVPDIDDRDTLEKHLSGIDTAVSFSLRKLEGAISGRTFTRSQLLETVAALVPGEPDSPIRIDDALQADDAMEGIARWCVSRALDTGTPLPEGIPLDALFRVSDEIDPASVTGAALSRIDGLGLPDATVNRFVSLMADGTLTLPASHGASPLVTALGHMVRRDFPDDIGAFASRLALYYRLTERMVAAAEAEWVSWLDACAGWHRLKTLPTLSEALVAGETAQWIVVDALGLPLAEAVSSVIEDFLPSWRLAECRFARLNAPTHTNGFYGRLAEDGVRHSFQKIDGLDRLIHQRRAPFTELSKLALAELAIAFKAVLGELDPSLPVLVFADHGFRISPDGKQLTHGGDSPLEAALPLLFLPPRRS